MKNQESKLLSQLKHQKAQLLHVLELKKDSELLSYSVLSKLTAAARANLTETSNVLNYDKKSQSMDVSQ